MISEKLENGSFEVKQGFVATNGTIPQNDGDNVIIKSQETQDFSEYLLPHGWKKVGRKRKNLDDKRKWDFTVLSPDGKRFKSNFALNQYLKRNPEVKCDLNVTNTSYPENLGLNWHFQNTHFQFSWHKLANLHFCPKLASKLERISEPNHFSC